jgi:hypothetical protein
MSALDYERTTLDANDLSYARQLAALEVEGWELEQHDGGGSRRYLRRHRRIDDIQHSFREQRRDLRFVREDDGTWSAVVRRIGAEAGRDDLSASGATPLEAAEAARTTFAPEDDQA